MRILLPLPDHDFDVTEVAVPWRLLTDRGHDVVFATEHGGQPPQADPLLLTGVLLGQLGAEPEPKRFYEELTAAPEYRTPIAWSEIEPAAYDGLVLPGGHAPGMRQYLGSSALQDKVAEFWSLDRPVGAICHGVLVPARAGVLTGRRTTCLPKYMERTAYLATAWRRGRYYRTYPAYVQDEVIAAGARFERGPFELSRRGTATDDTPAFVVRDGNYVSARWPGDAYLFARTFADLLEAHP
ncbi:type 1 glutamine amidotransferase domain-containing protein [Lentzea sp. BCCO 10_0856]|uniref:Type 1 glutamine amidotransferase domain-containing protein n=1 Tax=Lentzea miocenica TaxID=3095431 RepID=A0ABU4SSA2_9PSEU|nr:type 1 glutamine amidotransferase domain-containing protein [Lentzea sp. BCCO 10_0856]MDX8028761.1 type 1 glutamine amidotransferase domain-containing protein [Lentzea sp. BCCO 10_0856]